MKLKLIMVLVLGALASGTALWATQEASAASQPANSSGCCGFCFPGDICPACDLKKNSS